MKLIYINEKTHRRIKALALHQKRTMQAFLEVVFEAEIRKISPKKRNELYEQLDTPKLVPGGKPGALR